MLILSEQCLDITLLWTNYACTGAPVDHTSHAQVSRDLDYTALTTINLSKSTQTLITQNDMVFLAILAALT